MKRKTKFLAAVLATTCLAVILTSCKHSTDPDGGDQGHTPDAPSFYRITAVNSEPNRGLSITIKDNSDNETGFILEKSLDGSVYYSLATLSVDQTQYVDWGLDMSTSYYYRVCAVNANGRSDWAVDWEKTSGVQTHKTSLIQSISDTYVDSTFNTQNFGTENNLLVTKVERADGGPRKAYVKFPLTAIPNYATGIDYTELRLFTTNEPSDGGPIIHLREVLGNWSEFNVTWNSKPEVSFGALDLNQRVHNDGQPYYFDVTGAVRDWFDGEPNYGIQIESATNAYQAVFISREHSSAVRPTIQITYEW